jgi:hypothetical protein
MSVYKIFFYNDMGHLWTDPCPFELPKDILKFSSEKAYKNINFATSHQRIGTFYILKPGRLTEWTYTFGDHTIVLDYSQLDKFDETKMMWSWTR